MALRVTGKHSSMKKRSVFFPSGTSLTQMMWRVLFCVGHDGTNIGEAHYLRRNRLANGARNVVMCH